MNRSTIAKPFIILLILSLGLFIGAVCSPEMAEHEVVSEVKALPDKDGSQVQTTTVSLKPDLFRRYTRQEETAQEDQKYGPLFEGWDNPQAVLFITGRQDGYIEPCGCTGLENQLGGMMRRHTLLNQMRDKGWNVAGIDAGNQVKRFGVQSNLKLGTTYQCLGGDLQYSAIGLGPNDLKVPTLSLMEAMSNSGLENTDFVCANATLFEPGYISRFKVIEVGGKRICLTVVLGDKKIADIPPAQDVTIVSMDSVLAGVAAEMEAQKCDLNILIANVDIDRCRELAQLYPVFDYLVNCSVEGEPTTISEDIATTNSDHVTRLIQTGNKGMYVGVIGLFEGQGKESLRYECVPLDARFVDSEAIKEKFFSYQKQIESLGLSGLEVNPLPHSSGHKFIGSYACRECHEEAYDVWKKGIDGEGGPHFRATLDLTDPGERTWVQRHFDPECLSCHVTGWNPQEYFPYESGFLTLDDEKMHGNGCENCHGPGSMHAAAESGDIVTTEEQRTQFYEEMIVTLEYARNQMCATCHDLDNSPDFHEEGAFEKYWDQIKHYED